MPPCGNWKKTVTVIKGCTWSVWGWSACMGRWTSPSGFAFCIGFPVVGMCVCVCVLLLKSTCKKLNGGQQFSHYSSLSVVNIKNTHTHKQQQQKHQNNTIKQQQSQQNQRVIVKNKSRERKHWCFAVIYLPCCVIKSQQVLLSSHSHGNWKREAEGCCLCTSQWNHFSNF